MIVYSTEETAQKLGVTTGTVRRYVHTQWLRPLRKVGRTWIFTADEVERCRLAGPKYRGGRPPKKEGQANE